MQATKATITSGTKEWADSNINIYSGCSHDCVYCYAKKMAIRFKRKTADTWSIMELNAAALHKNYAKRTGRIMFPTSHDITEDTVDTCILVLKKLLAAGNEVLITSKPHPLCIRKIMEALSDYRDNIQFRFTITSHNDATLKQWEPHAPSFYERLTSLRDAYMKEFKTSVSIEPYLDITPVPLIFILEKYVTDTIWVGKLNYCTAENNTWDNVQYVMYQLRNNLPDDIKAKIRIKDSICNLYKKKGESLRWD